MQKQVPFLLSFLALIVASYAVVQSSNSNPPANPQSSVPRAASKDAATLDNATAVLPSAPVQSESAASAGSDQELILLSAALNDIQARLARMENQLGLMQSGWEGLARRGLVPLTPGQESELLRQIMDPTASLRDRLAAMQLLRRHNKLTDPALAAMVQLAGSSTDANTRRQIYSAMDGLTNAVIMPALLTALSKETDARAREEAADSLSGFVSDPSVQDWLRNAAENDPDPRVRREALESLLDQYDNMPSDQLKQAVMDPDLGAREKLAILSELRQADARTPDVIASALEFYLSSDDPAIRSDIFRQMDGVNDPVLKIPLLDGLANDPNPRVREEAADTLSGYLNDPSVVEWLQFAAQNDPDPRVRREAASALGQGNGRR